MGLYYKDYNDVNNLNIFEIDEHIEMSKANWNEIDDNPWETHLMAHKFALIGRIASTCKELYDKNIIKFNKPVISGIALYKNYPVGTYFPKELLKYKSFIELNNSHSLSKDDIDLIFDKVELWVKSLINNGVYSNIYLANILINPNNYSDVVLGCLDGPSICRIENDKYATILAKKGLNLKEL